MTTLTTRRSALLVAHLLSRCATYAPNKRSQAVLTRLFMCYVSYEIGEFEVDIKSIEAIAAPV
jgi:hypothetical protein